MKINVAVFFLVCAVVLCTVMAGATDASSSQLHRNTLAIIRAMLNSP